MGDRTTRLSNCANGYRECVYVYVHLARPTELVSLSLSCAGRETAGGRERARARFNERASLSPFYRTRARFTRAHRGTKRGLSFARGIYRSIRRNIGQSGRLLLLLRTLIGVIEQFLCLAWDTLGGHQSGDLSCGFNAPRSICEICGGCYTAFEYT